MTHGDQGALGEHYVRFHDLARTLRRECPWDRIQDHASLRRYVIEEAYEVVDAIDGLDPTDPGTDEALVEELGDLLYQIEFHAAIAEQQGRFDITDVTAHVHDKLVSRHPHVFGDVEADEVDQVLANWETLKRAEKHRSSVFDGVPPALPSLAFADKVQRRAATVGFDWPNAEGAFAKVTEETEELRRAADDHTDDDASSAGHANRVEDELGDLLFAVVNVARHLGLDSEVALRKAARRFQDRFTTVERLAVESDIEVSADTDAAVLDDLWERAKAVEQTTAAQRSER